MPVINMLNEDCMLGMARTPDKFYDLSICDPPYGIARFSVNEHRDPKSKFRRSITKMVASAKKWNGNLPTAEYFKELFRVSNNQIIWGANNFTLPASEYFLIWDKEQTVDNFSSAEYAWVSMGLKQPAKVFRYSIHRANRLERVHPTQKPIQLYKWLLQNYAKTGDRILDTHGGSGSICIACHDLGYDLDWYELDADYYASAVKRFEKHKSQPDMFRDKPVNNLIQRDLV